VIEGLSHITLVVADLEKAARFFRAIFAAQEIYDSCGKNFSLSHEKFFLIGGTWIAVMEGDGRRSRSYDHIAFKIADSDVDTYAKRIRELGVEVKPGRGRVEGEGRSLYFYDYDGHLFELHTGALPERLERYGRE
jgi:fosfomycin resistance protein FosX